MQNSRKKNIDGFNTDNQNKNPQEIQVIGDRYIHPNNIISHLLIITSLVILAVAFTVFGIKDRAMFAKYGLYPVILFIVFFNLVIFSLIATLIKIQYDISLNRKNPTPTITITDDSFNLNMYNGCVMRVAILDVEDIYLRKSIVTGERNFKGCASLIFVIKNASKRSSKITVNYVANAPAAILKIRDILDNAKL
ncbi:MAG: hypothetical protein LBF68_02820 [Christensenellaceae bacterium]|jgi:hypothetical protein|nr:hypothetical protein [Christensenellaceae bacterium]